MGTGLVRVQLEKLRRDERLLEEREVLTGGANPATDVAASLLDIQHHDGSVAVRQPNLQRHLAVRDTAGGHVGAGELEIEPDTLVLHAERLSLHDLPVLVAAGLLERAIDRSGTLDEPKVEVFQLLPVDDDHADIRQCTILL